MRRDGRGIGGVRREGRVLGESSDGYLLVEFDAANGCRACAAGRGCGFGVLERRGVTLRLPFAKPPGSCPSPGERVSIELEDDSRWLAVVALAFGLPTLGLVGAGITASLAGIGDIGVALAGIGGLSGGIVACRAPMRSMGEPGNGRPCVGAGRIAGRNLAAESSGTRIADRDGQESRDS